MESTIKKYPCYVKGIEQKYPNVAPGTPIYANAVEVDAQQRTIRFSIEMDDTSSVMDFMAIYLTRMQMCEEAAHFLGCRFELVVNGVHINRQGAPR